MIKVELFYGPAAGATGAQMRYDGKVQHSVQSLDHYHHVDVTLEDLFLALSSEVTEHRRGHEDEKLEVSVHRQSLSDQTKYTSFVLTEEAVEELVSNPRQLLSLYETRAQHISLPPKRPAQVLGIPSGVDALADAFGEELYCSYDTKTGKIESPFTGRWEETLPVMFTVIQRWAVVKVTDVLGFSCTRYWFPRDWGRGWVPRDRLEYLLRQFREEKKHVDGE